MLSKARPAGCTTRLRGLSAACKCTVQCDSWMPPAPGDPLTVVIRPLEQHLREESARRRGAGASAGCCAWHGCGAARLQVTVRGGACCPRPAAACPTHQPPARPCLVEVGAQALQDVAHNRVGLLPGARHLVHVVAGIPGGGPGGGSGGGVRLSTGARRAALRAAGKARRPVCGGAAPRWGPRSPRPTAHHSLERGERPPHGHQAHEGRGQDELLPLRGSEHRGGLPHFCGLGRRVLDNNPGSPGSAVMARGAREGRHKGGSGSCTPHPSAALRHPTVWSTGRPTPGLIALPGS